VGGVLLSCSGGGIIRIGKQPFGRGGKFAGAASPSWGSDTGTTVTSDGGIPFSRR